MSLRIAWRNIWRNPRRTAIVVTAVIVGVWSQTFLTALMQGMVDEMIRNGISTLTGDLQVHHQGYFNDPSIRNSLPGSEVPGLETALLRFLPSGSKWAPRVRVASIVQNARHTEGAVLVGIDPGREAGLSFIGEAVTEGRYLEPDDKHGIVVGRALAVKMGTGLGRKLVLMSQDTTGENVSRAFRIVGIFRAQLEATEKQFVFVSLTAAQQMLKLNKGISEISVLLSEDTELETTADSLQSALPSTTYEVQTWRELKPLLVASAEIFNGFVYMWYGVVFVAMGFGIVNTMLMVVFERMREFGLFKALGMKPWWIIQEVLTEACLVLLIGIVLGNVAGILTVLPLAGKGIDLSALAVGMETFGMPRVIYPLLSLADMVGTGLVIFLLGALVSLYPAVKAARFTAVEALTHV
jgi:ABC-type lipoprotein release transport system permease subunit